LDDKTELEQKFCIYPHYSSFLTKKMFAAILNSVFIVLLSMVFVQRNFIETNITKKFEMSTKFILMFKKQQRNITGLCKSIPY
jgi:hypothetical protein